jgi:4-amino-4-deoxy-L-arabinose transferase-like glycosyltransferase
MSFLLKNTWVLLGLIVLVAFFLRFYKVAEVPPALNWDEVSIGYNAYSILKTGRDEWNVFSPVHFKAYGEYKLPLQIYASIPGIAVFGLNEFGVRITPVLYGILTVLLVYFLTKELFGKKEISLLAALFLAVSPWHIHLTRGSFESSFSVMFITLGVWFLVKGFKKPKWLIWSMLPFALSIFTYNSARAFTPLYLLAVLFIYRKHFLKVKKHVFYSLILFVILIIPLIPSLFSAERSARYKLVSITDDPGLVPRINENRGNSNLPNPLPKIVHNKITYVSFYFTKNYLAHFTPDFLYITGAPHKQHHVQNIGQLYWIQAPFLLLGLYLLFKRKEKYRWILISWVILAYIPVSITNDSIPHALRTLIAAPFYQIISAHGLFFTFLMLGRKGIRWKYVLGFAVAVIFVIQFILYLYQYYWVYPKNYSRDWQYGYKQVVNYISLNQYKYDLVVFTRHFGEPHMFYLFFSNYDPAKYQVNTTLNRFETYDWVRVLKFDQMYFPDLGDKGTQFYDIIAQYPGKKILFIGKYGDFPSHIPRLYTVDFLNGDRAFEVVESR